jgi:hypothetical protein
MGFPVEPSELKGGHPVITLEGVVHLKYENDGTWQMQCGIVAYNLPWLGTKDPDRVTCPRCLELTPDTRPREFGGGLTVGRAQREGSST